MSNEGHNLFKETEAAKALRANLADIIGDDEDFAADVVSGETNLNEAIDAAVKRMVDDEIAISGLETMISALAARLDRHQERVKSMKTAIAVAMEQAGRKKIEHPAVTLTLKATPASVIITDEAAIPSRFWKPKDPTLDKRAIGDALKNKIDVPGATLSNGGSTLQAKWS